jgi:hypothetical protein
MHDWNARNSKDFDSTLVYIRANIDRILLHGISVTPNSPTHSNGKINNKNILKPIIQDIVLNKEKKRDQFFMPIQILETSTRACLTGSTFLH